MEDKELDKIFKESLERQRDFSGTEEQWELLAPKLVSGGSRKLLLLPLILALVVVSALGFWWLTGEIQDLPVASKMVTPMEQQMESKLEEVIVEEPKIKRETTEIESEIGVNNTLKNGRKRTETFVSLDRNGVIAAAEMVQKKDIAPPLDNQIAKEGTAETIFKNNAQITETSDEVLSNLKESTSEGRTAYGAEPQINDSSGTYKRNEERNANKKQLKAISQEDSSLANSSIYFMPVLELFPLNENENISMEPSIDSYGQVVNMSPTDNLASSRLALSAGLRYIDYGNVAFVEAEKWSVQAGLTYSLSTRWTSTLRINRRQVDRTFNSEFEKYDLLIDTLDYSAFSLTEVNQQATQWNGEIEFGYLIVKKKRFQLGLHQGIQSRFQHQETRTSKLESVYQAREINVPITNSFRFGSMIYTGFDTNFAFSSRFGLLLSYHYQYSLNNSTIESPAQHVIDAGFYYKIK